ILTLREPQSPEAARYLTAAAGGFIRNLDARVFSDSVEALQTVRYTSTEARSCGTKDDSYHEGVRTCWREPAHHLQLARERQDRVRSNCRRLRADFCRLPLAGAQSSAGRGVRRCRLVAA